MAQGPPSADLGNSGASVTTFCMTRRKSVERHPINATCAPAKPKRGKQDALNRDTGWGNSFTKVFKFSASAAAAKGSSGDPRKVRGTSAKTNSSTPSPLSDTTSDSMCCCFTVIRSWASTFAAPNRNVSKSFLKAASVAGKSLPPFLT